VPHRYQAVFEFGCFKSGGPKCPTDTRQYSSSGALKLVLRITTNPSTVLLIFLLLGHGCILVFIWIVYFGFPKVPHGFPKVPKGSPWFSRVPPRFPKVP